MKYINIPIFISHEGCPFTCIFCDQRQITGSQGNPEKEDIIKVVEEHIKSINLEDSRVEIAYFGGSFTMLDRHTQKYYLEIASNLVNKYKLAGIRISTRPDGIDWGILDFLSAYNVTTIELGVQSLDDVVLQASKRGYDVIDVLRAVNLIRRYKFQLGLQMMVGLPEDSYDRSVYTAEKIAAMKPDFVRIYPTLILKGTGLETMTSEKRYIPWEVDETIEVSAVVLGVFMKHNIPIARYGLYSEELEITGGIVAGPTHPALKELVLSRMFRDQIEKFMDLGEKKLSLQVSTKDKGYVYGHKRENYDYFKSRYGIEDFEVTTSDDLERYQFLYKDKLFPLY